MAIADSDAAAYSMRRRKPPKVYAVQSTSFGTFWDETFSSIRDAKDTIDQLREVDENFCIYEIIAVADGSSSNAIIWKDVDA